MQAGWLDDITNWLSQLVRDVWEAFVTFVRDVVLHAIDIVLEGFSLLIEAIPVPGFLEGVSLGQYLGQLPGGVQWMLSTFRLPECFAILAAGVAFRLLRKLVTLGQW